MISTPTLFYFPNNYDSIIISLRSITSYFIMKNKMCNLEEIELCPLEDSVSKLIELVNENEECTYFEHPQSFQLVYPSSMKPLHFQEYKDWIQQCITYSKRYPKLQYLLETFYQNEINAKFEPINAQIKFLEEKVNGFDSKMILPFFDKKLQFEDMSLQFMNSVDWQSLLTGHIHACTILFSQISSDNIRNNILSNIFKVVQLFSPRLERIVDNPEKLKNLVLDFKRESNKIIGDHAAFVNTNKISFRTWFLSLSQFSMYCIPFSFPVQQSLTHLNLILYLCFTNDEIHTNQKITVQTKKGKTFLSKHQSKKLRTIHPFVRNIYHPIYTS